MFMLSEKQLYHKKSVLLAALSVIIEAICLSISVFSLDAESYRWLILFYSNNSIATLALLSLYSESTKRKER